MINIIFVLQIETVSFETIISKHCHPFFFHCYLSIYFYYVGRFTNLKDNIIKELTLKYFNFIVRLRLGGSSTGFMCSYRNRLSVTADGCYKNACMHVHKLKLQSKSYLL